MFGVRTVNDTKYYASVLFNRRIKSEVKNKGPLTRICPFYSHVNPSVNFGVQS